MKTTVALLLAILIAATVVPFFVVSAADKGAPSDFGSASALYAHAVSNSADTQAWQAWQSVHDEDFVGRLEVRARNENVVELFVREGICLGDVLVVGAVDGLALLGEYHGYIVQVGDECRDGDTACLDGEHLIELDVGKTAFELFADFLHQADVDLVV